jgi:hypothetical protein
MGDPAIGNNSVVVVDFEQSWGVAKGSPKGRKISVVECGILPTRPLLQNPSLRASFNPSKPFLGQPKSQGPITLIPNVQVLPFIHKLATGVLVKSGAAKATGTITCVAVANLIDGETVTLDDGVNAPVVFEFDVNGTGVDGSNVQVDVSLDTSAIEVAATLHAAINGVGAGLAITSVDNLDGTLTLTNDAVGTVGNEPITDTVADAGFTVTGMTGGAALPYVATSRLGTTMPKSAIVENSFDIGGTLKYARATGVRVNGWTIPIAFEGPMQLSLDTMAKTVTYEDTPYDATPDDWTVEDPADQMHLISGHLKVDGSSVGWVKGGQLQGAANLKDDFRAAVLGRGSLVPGTHGLNGNLQVALESEDVLDFVTSGGDVDLEFLWRIATNQAFKTKYHVRMEITGPAVKDGLIDVPVNFMGFEDPLTGVAVEFETTLGVDPDTEYV